MASMTRSEPSATGLRSGDAAIPHSPGEPDNLARLELLAGVLTRRGLDARPLAPEGRMPRLAVQHPAGESGEVYAWRCQDGAWWFWWAWAERIAAGSDLERAAMLIERELASPTEP
jgi:hypothetical protein